MSALNNVSTVCPGDMPASRWIGFWTWGACLGGVCGVDMGFSGVVPFVISVVATTGGTRDFGWVADEGLSSTFSVRVLLVGVDVFTCIGVLAGGVCPSNSLR